MKNIELVNLPQIIGFLGVILSLGFVAFEINQNTNLSRNQAYLQFGESLKDITIELATDDLLPDHIEELLTYMGQFIADVDQHYFSKLVNIRGGQ